MELVAELAPRSFLALVFAFGAVVGSFLNVVIARVPAGLSVVSPPSRCTRCGAQIAFYDNVPILSWMLLRARCRSCRAPISARYPMVEALTGVLSLAIFGRFGPTAVGLGWFAFAAFLVALAYIDIDTWTLPLELCVPLLLLGLVSPLWNPGLGRPLADGLEMAGVLFDQSGPLHRLVVALSPRGLAFLASLLGALLGAGLLWTVSWLGEKMLGKEAMGLGDVWLLAALGAWMGVQSLFSLILFSSLQGAVVGGLLLLLGRGPGGAGPDAAAEAPQTPESAAAAGPPAETAGGASPATGEAPAGAEGPAGSGGEDEDDWVPDATAVPFGPFLALAALELLLVGDLVSALVGRLLTRLG